MLKEHMLVHWSLKLSQNELAGCRYRLYLSGMIFPLADSDLPGYWAKSQEFW